MIERERMDGREAMGNEEERKENIEKVRKENKEKVTKGS